MPIKSHVYITTISDLSLVVEILKLRGVSLGNFGERHQPQAVGQMPLSMGRTERACL